MENIYLDGNTLSPKKLYEWGQLALSTDSQFKIIISDEALKKIDAAADFVSGIVKRGAPVYGINTGFGKFSEVSIQNNDLSQLQKNLIFSHATGVGDPLERDIVFMMWLLRLNTICRGHSGTRRSTVSFIIRLLEGGVLSDVPSRGSVGASGDLAPSAHASLVLLGEGTCSMPHAGSFLKLSAKKALENLGLSPIELAPKEGLSLINGTQLSTALALKVWAQGKALLKSANLAVAMSVEGLRGSTKIAHPLIAEAKNQIGVFKCAKEIASYFEGKSEVAESHKNCGKVQDAYSFRCAPQVHGVVWDELEQAENILAREMNSSSDNPLLFVDQALSLSGGNFHALYAARVSDSLAASLTILSSISERRIAQMMSPSSTGLPAFLIREGGLNSGLMMAHVTAAALVSENKSLCMPSSVDTIPTSDDREDHVSMGPGAGYKALQIVKNLRQVLSIEFFAAFQALHLLRPLKSFPAIESFCGAMSHAGVLPLANDRILSTDIHTIETLLFSKERSF